MDFRLSFIQGQLQDSARRMLEVQGFYQTLNETQESLQQAALAIGINP